MIVYCDSAVLIYYLDSAGTFQARATRRLSGLWAAGDVAAASDLCRLECRVRPMRMGDAAALSRFDTFFTQPGVRILPLTTAVYDRATAVRAGYGYKTIDAIHLAAAVENRCDRFLTNDARLSGFRDIPVEMLPP
jgi:predicted nucleic acid-binding protein